MAFTAQEIADKKLLLAEYLKAECIILKTSQSYTIKDRTYERAKLSTLINERRRLEKAINQMENGGKKVTQIVPRDW